MTANGKDRPQRGLVCVTASVDYCHGQDIRLYRLTSSLFPFAEGPPGEDVLEVISLV